MVMPFWRSMVMTQSDQPIMDAKLWIPALGGIRKGHVLGVSEKVPAQVREEMQQKLDDSKRRHKEEMEKINRLYQEQMQAMNQTVMRLATMMGLPRETQEMLRHPNREDDDCTCLGDDHPPT